MKRFYSVLFVGAALLSGNVYGMEREVNIRDYADVVNHLTTTAHFRADEEFEDLAITALPAIEDFVLANNKQNERQYARLCASYLNKVFSLPETDAEQVEIKFMERFFDDSRLALFYLQHKQEVIGQLNLDKLASVMQNVTDKKSRNIDTLMTWLSIFDETGHKYEQDLVTGLMAEICDKGLTNATQPWEHTILQKGSHLQGPSKQCVDLLRDKEQKERDQRQQLRADAENRKDRVVGRIFNALKANQNDQLDTLLQDELIGLDALLTDHLDYINTQIERRINNPKVKINNREELLKTWQNKFRFVEEQNTLEEEQHWQEAFQNATFTPEAQLEKKRLEEHQQQQEQERQRIVQWFEEQRQTEEILRQQQTEEQLRNRDEQQRQYEEQKSNQREQRKLKDLTVVEPKIDEPAVELPQQPDNPGDKPVKGVAAALMSIGAPKLFFVAVVVGVCYWGYTKYKAHKAAQAKESIKTADDNQEENNHGVQKNNSQRSKAQKNKRDVAQVGKRRG